MGYTQWCGGRLRSRGCREGEASRRKTKQEESQLEKKTGVFVRDLS